jgi:phosphohistidine phosphatase SixA
MKNFFSRRRSASILILLTLSLFAPLLMKAGAARPVQATDDGFKPKTVILVRHAERQDTSADSPLSAAGLARSQKLAEMFAAAGIKAIYTSQFLRTKQTAEPLAKQLGITLTAVPLQSKKSNPREVSEETLRQLVDKIMERAGETSLVVGHSNSVPEVIRMLGGDTVPVIDEKKFDDLFIVTIYAKGKAKVVQLKY